MLALGYNHSRDVLDDSLKEPSPKVLNSKFDNRGKGAWYGRGIATSTEPY